MTDNNHTPGPWRYSETECLRPDMAFAIVKDAESVDGPYSEHIAEVHFSTRRAHSRADAALIAAAPELLACLDMLFEACEDGASASEIVDYLDWGRLRTVYAKARGQEVTS